MSKKDATEKIQFHNRTYFIKVFYKWFHGAYNCTEAVPTAGWLPSPKGGGYYQYI